MIKKISYCFLFLLVFFLASCGDEKEEALQNLVKDQVVDDKPVKNITMAMIPAGSFEMGDHFNEGGLDERPVHTVELDKFYMDIHEVTVGQFREFVQKSGHEYPDDMWNVVAVYSPGDNYPMIYVNWHDAVAYAEWAGKRLPTEAEWEYAARSGLIGQRYPWGDEITHDDANYFSTGDKDKWRRCAPVRSFEANGYGLYDMVGNVYEWCSDWYGENYYSGSPAKNPSGPSTGEIRVLRGGSWNRYNLNLRLAYQLNYYPNNRNNFLGFRCVSGKERVK